MSNDAFKQEKLGYVHVARGGVKPSPPEGFVRPPAPAPIIRPQQPATGGNGSTSVNPSIPVPQKN